MRKTLTASIAVIWLTASAHAGPVAEAPSATTGSVEAAEQARTASTAVEPSTTPRRKARARTPEGQACSDQADAHNLRGTERQTFRRACIRDLRREARAGEQAAPEAQAEVEAKQPKAQ